MELPNNPAACQTERILEAIRPHLRQDPPPQEAYHWNRAYEKIYDILHLTLIRGDACQP